MTDPLQFPQFSYLSKPLLVPRPGVDWADTMVLNPTLIDEPGSEKLHMLFRATGPWPAHRQPGQPLPYPIFLGYAYSDNLGKDWQADFSRPCLAPRLAMAAEQIETFNHLGRSVVNYANGCIEDPRLFRLDGKCYLTAACRMFPPGPYWEEDAPMQCAPSWASEGKHHLGRAASENLTVSVLFEVNLQALQEGRYEEACRYVTHLTDPQRGDNRDVVLLPKKLRIDGKEQYVCLHRPMEPDKYGEQYSWLQPSIFMAAAERLEDLTTDNAIHRLLAQSIFPWEGDRIGTSWTPILLENGEWLLPYHGKQDAKVGYTQSFMILEPGENGWLQVKHRCSERLMYAQRDWELQGRFPTPCLFTCGGIICNGTLIMSYGAADTVSGIARGDFGSLVNFIRNFNEYGNAK